MVEIFYSSVFFFVRSAIIIHLIRRLAWFWMDVFILHTQHSPSKKIHFDSINICGALSMNISNVQFTFLIAAHFASRSWSASFQALFEFLVCHYLTFQIIIFDTRKVIFAETWKSERKTFFKMANIQSLVNHRSSADKESFTIFSIIVHLFILLFIRSFNHLIKHPIFILCCLWRHCLVSIFNWWLDLFALFYSAQTCLRLFLTAFFVRWVNWRQRKSD